MEITKELKEKLLKANSEEEVKALLGGSAEEKTSEFWQEIEAHHGALGLEKVDDDELEAVSGGKDRDCLKDGCSSTAKVGEFCLSNDSCSLWTITYSNFDPCPSGGIHDWAEEKRFYEDAHEFVLYRCKKCYNKKEVPMGE